MRNRERPTSGRWTVLPLMGQPAPSYTLELSNILAGSALNVIVTLKPIPILPFQVKDCRFSYPALSISSGSGCFPTWYGLSLLWGRLRWVGGEHRTRYRSAIWTGTPVVGATVLFDADNMGAISASAQLELGRRATAYVTNVIAGTTQGNGQD
ncbi:Uncharacterised protein [Serratia fonticola]|uniref:Uncharacterized protein n=1 Tax=Serratia fonticola TaxID=47917 RepID=A0A4U9VY81_SERFO|nr:Uncharacterised protein [Serratia fonticola]